MFDFLKDIYFETKGVDSMAIAEERKRGYIVWECQCDCGNRILASAEQLMKGYVQSCGCLLGVKDVAGMRFGKLTAIRTTGESKDGSHTWYCKCDCGNTTFVTTRNLTSGNAQSCGCQREEISNQEEKKVAKDLTGQRFGRLTAIRLIEKRKSKSEAKRKGRFIFSRGAKVITFILGILYLVIAGFNIMLMKKTGSLDAYQIFRFIFLVACDIASLVCIAVSKKKTEIAALILIVVFVIAQYFTTLLM